MKKKAQGISLNVIIIAVIALFVLVILMMIFTGKLAIFNLGVDKCDDFKNSVCRVKDVTSPEKGCFEDESPYASRRCYAGDDIDDTQICCIKI